MVYSGVWGSPNFKGLSTRARGRLRMVVACPEHVRRKPKAAFGSGGKIIGSGLRLPVVVMDLEV